MVEVFKPKPPPHPVSAVSAPNDAKRRTASVTQRRRSLLTPKSKPNNGMSESDSGHAEPMPAVTGVVAAVWMVNCAVAAELPGVSEAGEKVAVAPVGRPVAEKVTGFEYAPFCGVTVMEYCAEPPG